MTTSSYWIEREALHYKQNLLKLGTYDRRLDRLYRQAYAAVEKEIADFYVKYADQNGLSMADAKERIAKFDVLAYQDRVAELLKKEHLSAKAKQELKLYNATMKINRLEMLKANIGLSLIETYQEEEDAYRECLDDVARAEYRRQSGILGETTHDMPKELLTSTVEGSFHNATFSDRIWAHQDELRYRLESMLTNGLIQGKNPREYIPELRKQFNTSRYNASRLLRTEFARIQTDVQIKSFQEYGYDEYIFIANGTACPECAELNGQIFKVAEQQVGKNAPPVHPNCMCSTAAYTSRTLFTDSSGKRIIEPTGEPMSMDEAAKGANGKGTHNCQRCVQAYEMRRRGYDVEALDKGEGENGITWGNELFGGKGGKRPDYDVNRTAQSVVSEIQTAPVGARYLVYAHYKAGNAHVFMAEKTASGVEYVDPQHYDRRVDGSYFSDLSNTGGTCGCYRLDDKPLTTDMKLIKKAVRFKK